MSTKVEKRILVNVPVSVAYNQWTQFEDFPRFMGGVKTVKQLSDDRLEWTAEIAGVRRQWQATILEQVPDQKVAWAATEGATNAGSVTFEDLGGGQTSVQLVLEYEPDGLVEKIGDKLNVVENQAEADLNRFKAFIEDEGYATGAWRGSVDERTSSGAPGLDEAAGSLGDSGRAGVSGKLVAGVGIAAAAAGVAAAAADRKADSSHAAATPATTPSAAPPETMPPTGTTGSVFPPDSGSASGGTAADGPGARPAAKPFDQTNGLIDATGDSDGTASSDTTSAAEREAGADSEQGHVPPVWGSTGLR